MSVARLARTTLAAALLAGCALSHTLPRDGVAGGDDGGNAFDGGGGAPDAGGSSADGVPCGPNRCYDGEICCRASCGLCTDAEVCLPSLPCRRSEVVCGGVVCDPASDFCCSTCEAEVCPGPEIGSRAECPPVSCE